MTETIEASIISIWLSNDGPRVPNSDKPMFRLVWSDDQTEIRKGLVSYYHGSAKIAEGEEVRRFPKYSTVKERWILEQWTYPENVDLKELPETGNGTYEPRFVFQDSKFRPLPLRLDVVQIFVKVATMSKSTPASIKARIAQEIAEKEAILDRYTEDAIDTSDVQSLLHHGEAVIVPASFAINPPNLRKKQ